MSRTERQMTDADDLLGPDPTQPSLRRLGIAAMVAAVVVGLAMTLFAFLMASLSSASPAESIGPTLSAAGRIFPYVFGFTVTLGVAGLGLLRLLGLRSPGAWTLTGAAAGLGAAVLFALIEGAAIDRTLLLTCAMLGWGQFLVTRWVAGLR